MEASVPLILRLAVSDQLSACVRLQLSYEAKLNELYIIFCEKANTYFLFH